MSHTLKAFYKTLAHLYIYSSTYKLVRSVPHCNCAIPISFQLNPPEHCDSRSTHSKVLSIATKNPNHHGLSVKQVPFSYFFVEFYHKRGGPWEHTWKAYRSTNAIGDKGGEVSAGLESKTMKTDTKVKEKKEHHFGVHRTIYIKAINISSCKLLHSTLIIWTVNLTHQGLT